MEVTGEGRARFFVSREGAKADDHRRRLTAVGIQSPSAQAAEDSLAKYRLPTSATGLPVLGSVPADEAAQDMASVLADAISRGATSTGASLEEGWCFLFTILTTSTFAM